MQVIIVLVDDTGTISLLFAFLVTDLRSVFINPLKNLHLILRDHIVYLLLLLLLFLGFGVVRV